MPLAQGTTIGIGIGVVTGWLRAAVYHYVALCDQHRVRPATGIDAGSGGEAKIESKWSAINSKS